ncbi:MAG: hypothetical protein J6J13_06220 [Clostridia bacterium]|nr:hypothetical protein [Clostridia bacterium]
MECQNMFCIYQKRDKYILDEISLDISGRCECCIYPDVEEDILNVAKMKLLKKYGEEY